MAQNKQSRSISCTPEEWRMIRAGAAREGMSSSAYLVRLARQNEPGQRDPFLQDLFERVQRIEAHPALSAGGPGGEDSGG